MRLIGVGIDIVDVEVFRSRLDSGMVEELFLPREIGYCSSRARPWESYAARFAAKEAAFKSLGAGLAQGLRWKNVEVVREESGAVGIELSGAALKIAEEKNVSATALSISHTRDCAIAIVTMQG